MLHSVNGVWAIRRVIDDTMETRLAWRMGARRSSFMRCPLAQRDSLRGRVQGRRMGRNRCRRRMAHPMPIDASYGVTATVTACRATSVATKGMGANAGAGKAVTTPAASAAVTTTTAAATARVAATAATATAATSTGRPGAGQRRRGQSQGRHANEYRQFRVHDALSASTTNVLKSDRLQQSVHPGSERVP